MKNVTFRNIWIHGIGGEGFYLGNTYSDPAGQDGTWRDSIPPLLSTA
jgi:hypothetical protein